MIYEPNNEQTIRKFLLGDLSSAEQDEIEIRLLGDVELRTAVEIAEFDLIDDFVRGNLVKDEIARFERHFLVGADRRGKLETARVFLNPPKTVETAPETMEAPRESTGRGVKINRGPNRKRGEKLFDWRRAIPLGAGIAMVIALGVFVQRSLFQSPVDQAVESLKKAYASERPVESRLSGFDHAPWAQRRGDERQSAGYTLRDQAARILLGEVNDRPDARSRHALGNLYLLEQKTDEAIKQLEEALKADPHNAQIHSDLGAALMESAKTQKEKEARNEARREPVTTGSLLTFGRANEHFAQALQINPGLPEAQFNQALCLQYLGLVNQAAEAWRKYLQLDAASGWASEAQRKLAELEQQKKKVTRDNDQIIRDYLAACQSGDTDSLWRAFNLGREGAGNTITARLLDEYLDLSLQGKNEEANQRIDWLEQAASLEAQKGDLYTQDLISLYRGVSLRQRDLLVKARRLFKDAGKLESEKDTEALPLYQQARKLFEEAGSFGEAGLATYRIVRMQNLLYKYQAGRSEAESLISFATTRQYCRLQAEARIWLASLAMGLNEYSQALRQNNRALSLIERLDDPNSEVKIRVQQILLYYSMGNLEQSLARLTRPLELCRLYPLDPGNQWFVFGTASDCFNKLDLVFTAIACEREALYFAREMNNQLSQSRSYAYIGEMYGKMNKFPEAIAQIEKARAIGVQIGDTPAGQDIIEHALLRLGHLYRRQGALDKALAYYDESLRLSDRLRKDYDKLDIHRGKLLVHLARRDTAAAAELNAALQIFEQNMANITQESLRNSFFDDGQEIYDLALQFAADCQRDPEQAFNYSERGRARSLLDMLKDRSHYDSHSPVDELPIRSLADPLPLSEVKRQMPPSAQILQYALLSDMLYIWVVSRESFHSVAIPIRLVDLNTKIREYLDCLTLRAKAESHEAEQLSQNLYNILIGPVEGALDSGKELCIVPDEVLNYLPFAALIEPSSRRYLIERYTIVYAPSAAVFLACTETAKGKSRFAAERCLSLGHPLFDQESFPQLKDLPATADEAAQVAEFYLPGRLLLAGAAHESALRREARRAEVIHLASHGLVNTERPEYSGVLLSKETDGASTIADGVLRAGEVLRMRLARTKLVVLSACQTWLGHNYRGEGMVGLARAFIVADVPLIVASLWEVDSEPTGELMKNFHRRRTQDKLSTARALREAQLEMLRRPQNIAHSPNVWAAFITVGGYASY